MQPPIAPPAPPGPDLRSRDDWPAGRVLVQAATFNERENIAALIERVLAVSPDLQFLVIDDDSPDGTAEIVLAAASTISAAGGGAGSAVRSSRDLNWPASTGST